jgi:hypothetical protein
MSSRSFAVRTGVPSCLQLLSTPSLAAGSAGHETDFLSHPLSSRQSQILECLESARARGTDETSQVQKWERASTASTPRSSPAHRASAQLHNTLRDALACVVRVLSKNGLCMRALSRSLLCCVLAAQCIWVGVGASFVGFLDVLVLFCEVRAFLSSSTSRCSRGIASYQVLLSRSGRPILLTRYEPCTLSRASQYTET